MNFFRLAVLALGLAGACGQGSEKAPDPTPTPNPTPDPNPVPDPKPSPAGRCGVCSVTSDEELRAHHQKVAGEPMDDHCIRRVTEGPFAGAVVVGAFAHDRGCIATGVHHQCCFHADAAGAAAPLLAAAGWASADATRRAELALAFTDNVLNAFDGRFLQHPPDDWAAAKKPFAAPAATPAPAGAFTVRGWVHDPPGMINETRYNLIEHTFDSSGNHVSVKQADTVVTR